MDKLELIYSPEDIRIEIKRLAAQISKDYSSSNPLLICILKGAFIFLSDLIRELTIPVEIDFMKLSSYGGSTKTSGEINISMDISASVKDRDIIIVDDIVDTGHTFNFLTSRLKKENFKTCRLLALIDKSERREKVVNIDYYGFRLSKGFVVGYGMDCNEKYRYLPGIYALLT